VAGSEVEHAALSDLPYAAATEVFAFVPTFLEHHFIRRWDMEGFAVHLGLWDVPMRGQSSGDGMLRQNGGEVAGRSVRTIGGEHALRQCELPNAVLVGERGREGGTVFDAFVIRLLIDELPLCRGALSLGKLLERIRLCALLHEADEGLCPMSGMQNHF